MISPLATLLFVGGIITQETGYNQASKLVINGMIENGILDNYINDILISEEVVENITDPSVVLMEELKEIKKNTPPIPTLPFKPYNKELCPINMFVKFIGKVFNWFTRR